MEFIVKFEIRNHLLIIEEYIGEKSKKIIYIL